MNIYYIKSALFVLVIAIILSQPCLAQKTDKIPVTVTTRNIGPDSINKRSVAAVEYIFPERIQDFSVDTVNKFLTLELRGVSKNGKWLDNKGDVVRFATSENKVLWSKKIFYQSQSIDQYGGVTLHTTAGKVYSLNNESGEPVWEVKNSILYVNRPLNMAIGYKLKASKAPEILEGISLNDGQSLWERKIRGDLGWNDLFHLNDSTLLIAAAGLHTLNLKNGKGWDYEATTGKKDYTGSAVSTGLGLAAGLLTGMYSVSTGHDLVKDLCSNILTDSSAAIYFASKQELVALSKNGEVLWNTPLTEEETSRSVIFKKGSNLFLINFGYANRGQQKVNFGKPYFASFNLGTGQLNFKTIISNDKESIRDFKFQDDEIFLVFNKRLEKYSLRDGRLTGTNSVDISQTGELKYFVGDQVFIKSEARFTCLTDLNPQKLHVYTGQGKFLIFDHSLKLINNTDVTDAYIAYLRNSDISILGKRKECIVVNKKGELLLGLPGTTKVALLNNQLYTTNESSLLKINVSDLKEN